MRIHVIRLIWQNIKKVQIAILDFLFPQNAFEANLRDLNPSSFAENASVCSHEPPSVRVLYSYKNQFVRRAILALKFRGNNDSARLFGALLYDLLLEDLADLFTFNSETKPILIPIPLSKSRLKSRGYNQVELVTNIIETLDKETNLKHIPKALVRIKDAPSQTKLSSKTERIKNLSGAFRANPAIVSGKTIILVDDVVTTGTTLKEARRALKNAGARKIRSYALAH